LLKKIVDPLAIVDVDIVDARQLSEHFVTRIAQLANEEAYRIEIPNTVGISRQHLQDFGRSINRDVRLARFNLLVGFDLSRPLFALSFGDVA